MYVCLCVFVCVCVCVCVCVPPPSTYTLAIPPQYHHLRSLFSPSCLHTTWASLLSHWLSHTVPHWLLMHISTLPRLASPAPISLTAPSTQAELFWPARRGGRGTGCDRALWAWQDAAYLGRPLQHPASGSSNSDQCPP